MFQKLMTGALIAGGAAGLLAAFLHFSFVQEYILMGERYEYGEIVHFQTAPTSTESHDHVAPEQPAAMGADTHDHSPSAPSADNVFSRNALTIGFTVVLYVAYAMLMIAAFGVAAQFGITIGATQGALWGLTGFAAFQLAPAMGLPPELPGTVAPDLGVRQVWWWGTVFATGLGVGLIAYGRSLVLAVGGVVLLAAPHVIGAPQLDEFFSYAPAELGAAFSARVLGVGLVVWVVMGSLAGLLWSRTQEA